MKRISLILAVFFLLSISVNAQNLQPTKIRVNNLEFNYVEQGQGEPLILLHGGMELCTKIVKRGSVNRQSLIVNRNIVYLIKSLRGFY
jgi:hypothetical protein